MKKFYSVFVTIVALVSLAGNALLYMRYSSARAIVQINGDVITKKDLEDRLDYLDTSSVLRDMILNKLVLQAAAKQNCVPTDKDIAAAKNDMMRATPQIVEAAYKSDPSLIVFTESLKTNLAMRSLRVAGVQVTDDEARQFYATHKNLFQLPVQASTSVVFAQDQVAAQTAQRMLENGVAPSVIAAQAGLNVMGVNAAPSTPIPSNITEAALRMRQGEVQIFPMGSNFVVIQIKKVAPGGVPSYEAIKDRVQLAARLAKAPTEDEELAKLVGSSKITLESDKPAYANAVPQLGTSVASGS